MIMVVHQAPGVTHPVELPDHLPQRFEEQLAIFVVLEDVFATVTARCDVIEGAGEFDAEGAGNAGIIAEIVGGALQI